MRLEELHVRNRVVAYRLAHVGTAPPAEPPTAKNVRRLPEALRVGMRREARRRTLWWKARAAGCVVFGAQFVVLVAISMFFYNRFNLGIDFAIFNQAWTQIGHGNLDPYSTIQSVSFRHLNFDIVMWPLGALYRIFPQPSLLLWVQAGALAGTGLVCFFWISELLERRSLQSGTGARPARRRVSAVAAQSRDVRRCQPGLPRRAHRGALCRPRSSGPLAWQPATVLVVDRGLSAVRREWQPLRPRDCPFLPAGGTKHPAKGLAARRYRPRRHRLHRHHRSERGAKGRLCLASRSQHASRRLGGCIPAGQLTLRTPLSRAQHGV